MHFELFLMTMTTFSPISVRNNVDDLQLYTIGEFNCLELL